MTQRTLSGITKYHRIYLCPIAKHLVSSHFVYNTSSCISGGQCLFILRAVPSCTIARKGERVQQSAAGWLPLPGLSLYRLYTVQCSCVTDCTGSTVAREGPEGWLCCDWWGFWGNEGLSGSPSVNHLESPFDQHLHTTISPSSLLIQ